MEGLPNPNPLRDRESRRALDPRGGGEGVGILSSLSLIQAMAHIFMALTRGPSRQADARPPSGTVGTARRPHALGYLAGQTECPRSRYLLHASFPVQMGHKRHRGLSP